jgi:hypothetical protein
MAALDVIDQYRQRRQIIRTRIRPACGELAEYVRLIDISP